MRWVGCLALVSAWWIVTAFNFVDPVFLASPVAVAKETTALILNGELTHDAYTTTTRTILGFILGAALGICAGILLGNVILLRLSLEGILDFLRSIPVVVLFPLFVVMFGIGDVSKILGIAWAVFPIMAINTMYGVASTNPTRREWLQLMGITGFRLVRLSLIWEILPSVLAGMRTSFAAALIMSVVSEMLFGTTAGLGRMIYDASTVYAIPKMYSGIVAIGLIGFVSNVSFRFAEDRLKTWN